MWSTITSDPWTVICGAKLSSAVLTSFMLLAILGCKTTNCSIAFVWELSTRTACSKRALRFFSVPSRLARAHVAPFYRLCNRPYPLKQKQGLLSLLCRRRLPLLSGGFTMCLNFVWLAIPERAEHDVLCSKFDRHRDKHDADRIAEQ